jgi:hypothetical protein
VAAGPKLTDEFRTDTIVIRGTTYQMRELSAGEYDEILKIASGPDDNADLSTVLRMMTVKCILEPKLTGDDLNNKPYPVYTKLLNAVQKLHFSPDGETPEGETPNS